jgi:2-hydroxychromene-2-carboxylate isomerase
MTRTHLAGPLSESAPPPPGVTLVDFWFDPLCPWAWITSRWMVETAAVRDVVPRWHVMSLAVLNENASGLSETYRSWLATAWGPVRVCAAAAGAYGEDVLGDLYTALGRRLHVAGEPNEPATLEGALRDAALDPRLARAAESTEHDDDVRASHARAIELVGEDVGTPVVAFGGSAFFGPVVTPIPRGEDAGRLWDAVRGLAQVDGFFELKRSRDRSPQTS